jgi:outer membrane protein OmpA-like peptidoglycan-associated protein
MKTIVKLVLVAAAFIACGHAPTPNELVEARAAYTRASNGKTNELQPAQVYEAKQALDKAEAKFRDDAGSQAVKDLAYIALRKVQYAEAMARVTVADERLKAADKESRSLDGKALERAQAALRKSQEDMENQKKLTEAERARAVGAAADAEKARQDAEKERQARLEAEKRMKQAIDDLAKIAAIKEEQRGMVITLTGNVLFESGKWALLPGAQIKLNEVAEALKMNKDRDITIEGHTDNQGTKKSNVDLGQHRAESVRDYIVSRGVDGARVTAVGVGQDRPIADNSSPEGRANNRRVEIIVSPAKEAR